MRRGVMLYTILVCTEQERLKIMKTISNTVLDNVPIQIVGTWTAHATGTGNAWRKLREVSLSQPMWLCLTVMTLCNQVYEDENYEDETRKDDKPSSTAQKQCIHNDSGSQSDSDPPAGEADLMHSWHPVWWFRPTCQGSGLRRGLGNTGKHAISFS